MKIRQNQRVGGKALSENDRGMQRPHMNEAYTVLVLSFTDLMSIKHFFVPRNTSRQVRKSHHKFEIVFSDGNLLTFCDGQRKLTVPVLL